MFRNYLVTAVRNLFKHRFYSLINILGLALGLTCSLFIFIFVKDELSFDRFHEKAGRIYRVHFDGHIFEQNIHIPQVGDPWGPTLLENIPEVEQQVRLRNYGDFLVKYEENSYKEEKIIFADSTFFDVFSFSLLQGDPEKALAEPFTVVITPALAKKYFGSENPVGKTLVFDNEEQFRITGILREMPRNAHFHYSMVASLASRNESRSGEWMSFNFNTYLVLKEGVDPKIVEAKLPQIARTNIGAQMEQFIGQSWDDFMAAGNKIQFTLFPLTRIHLYSHLPDELGPNGDIKYVYIFSFIGIFILLLACINFMNLATARSANRAREVGMRKVVGAGRGQLIIQFLSESVLMSLLAVVIAFLAAQFLLPSFNQLSGKIFHPGELRSPGLLATLAFFAATTGLLAGAYPALFLSAFRPIQVLKGSFNKGAKSGVFRSGLVVFQFAITIALIVGTLVIFRQLNYIRQKKLGYEREQILLLDDTYALENNVQPFKQELLKNPEVIDVTVSGYLPTPSSRNNSGHFSGRNPLPENMHVIQTWVVDHDYLRTLGMELVAGRDFSREFATDSLATVINEAAVEIFGFEGPIGQEISRWSGNENNPNAIVSYHVIGVVKDFHFESLRHQIGPLMMRLGSNNEKMAVKVKTNDVRALVADLQDLWNRMAPGQPFNYRFMDDDFNEVYSAEVRIGRIVSVFAFLAIAIACLGLFGLATFVAEQRTKEIGIRKVLGASIPAIFVLLTKEFSRWILLAGAIGLPAAYWFMTRWLQGFEYQAGIGWITLLTALLSAVVIALLTVSFQAIRAARTNPVNALKYE